MTHPACTCDYMDREAAGIVLADVVRARRRRRLGVLLVRAGMVLASGSLLGYSVYRLVSEIVAWGFR